MEGKLILDERLLADVSKDTQDVANPVYSDAVRTIKKNDKLRAAALKREKTPENRKPKNIRTPALKKMHLSEALFEAMMTIEQAQAEVDNAITKFGRVGAKLYDDLDENGFYLDQENKVQLKVPANEEEINIIDIAEKSMPIDDAVSYNCDIYHEITGDRLVLHADLAESTTLDDNDVEAKDQEVKDALEQWAKQIANECEKHGIELDLSELDGAWFSSMSLVGGKEAFTYNGFVLELKINK